MVDSAHSLKYSMPCSPNARNVQQLLLKSDVGTQSKKPKRFGGDRLSDGLFDDEDGYEDSDEERHSRSKKKKSEGAVLQPSLNRVAGDKLKAANSIHDLLQHFLQKQQQIEFHWWEMIDSRVFERQQIMQEWRQSMKKLERERLMLECTWREREEQRRMREECTADKKGLLTTLLNKLIQGDYEANGKKSCLDVHLCF